MAKTIERKTKRIIPPNTTSHLFLISYMVIKDNLWQQKQRQPPIPLMTEEDYREILDWSKRAADKVVDKLINPLMPNSCNDLTLCPWCLLLGEDNESKPACFCCAYGKRNGYCIDDTDSIYQRIRANSTQNDNSELRKWLNERTVETLTEIPIKELLACDLESLQEWVETSGLTEIEGVLAQHGRKFGADQTMLILKQVYDIEIGDTVFMKKEDCFAPHTHATTAEGTPFFTIADIRYAVDRSSTVMWLISKILRHYKEEGHGYTGSYDAGVFKFFIKGNATGRARHTSDPNVQYRKVPVIE